MRRVRAALPPMLALSLGLAMPLGLTGCKKEPDFDAQYDKTSREIEARAKKIDADMAQQMRAMDREMEVRGFAAPTPQPSPAPGSPTPK